MTDNFLIGYPDDGTRKRDVVKGITTIDFFSGLVKHPDGTTTNLNKQLRNSGQFLIRSVVVFCTLGTKIKLGHNNPVRIFADQCNWNVFENIEIQEMSIELTSTLTPDESDLQVIASTSRKAIYVPKVVKIHETKRVSSQNSTDSYATLFERHAIQFNNNTFILAETGGSNDVTYKIEVKHSSAGTYRIYQGDTSIVAGEHDIIEISGVYHFIKVSIKATVGASQGTIEGEWLGQG